MRFLGMHFDSKLTWHNHIEKVVDKCKKVINIIRCLCNKEWGADMTSMKILYVGLIRSIVDYGCMAYGSAAKSELKNYDVIQGSALRICSGAMRTSPISALQVEVGELPFELRRLQMSLSYYVHLKGHVEDHPTKSVLISTWEQAKSKRVV